MEKDNAKECFLCQEVLGVDDLAFFPCTCDYQVCRFCWHSLKTNGDGLCPQCWKPYLKNPENFTFLSQDEITALRAKRNQDQHRLENQKYLANLRVLQKNLVFATCLPNSLADSDILKRYECFGQYGQILKITINKNALYLGQREHMPSAYITYYHSNDAMRAILALNNTRVYGRCIKPRMGTTKYCTQFVKNLPCLRRNCIYLHDFDPEASFTKEEIIVGEHHKYEKRLLDKFCQKINEKSALAKMHNKVLPLVNSSGIQAQYTSNQIEHFYFLDGTPAKLLDYQPLQQNVDYLYKNNGIQSNIEGQGLLDDKLYESTKISNSTPYAISDDDLDFDPIEEVQKAFASIDSETNFEQNSNREYKNYEDNSNQKIPLLSSTISNKNTFDIEIPPEQKRSIQSRPDFNINYASNTKQEIPVSVPQQQQTGENIGMVYDRAKWDLALMRISEILDQTSIGVHDTNYLRQRSVSDNSNISQNAMNDNYGSCPTNAHLEHFCNDQIYSHNALVGIPQHANMIPFTDVYNNVHRSMNMPMPIQNLWQNAVQESHEQSSIQNKPYVNDSTPVEINDNKED
ncbi:uncharacterized protein LOC113382041 [Ctenocephalides felis]|uniref:uncharacterized protein LOC113376009 n=1 Tax=Ctenocephalides felis TaxID=7515 RepID=UPI000E6E539F|nr:uncharacterized protein LOC113376009 [Ctenocephalides felis]XP_026476389.1 uncharacterized protein LOC113382041 [Ctenocephalides felis]